MKIYLSKENLESIETALKLVQNTIPNKNFPKEEKNKVVSNLQDVIEKHVLRENKEWGKKYTTNVPTDAEITKAINER